MKWIASIVVLFTALVSAQAPATKSAAAPAKRPAKQYTMEQFLDTTSIQGGFFSADESRGPLLVEQDRHLERVHGSGRRRRVDAGHEIDEGFDLRRFSFFPHDNRVLITRDQGGNELNHLYVPVEAGEEKDLTPGDKLKAQFGGWTHDGGAFYVVSNERDPKFFDIYRYDAKSYARTMFYENKDGYFPGRRVRRWQVARAGQAEHDQRQRYLSSGTPRRRQIDAHLEAHRQREQQPRAVRPRVEASVLPDRRERRVHCAEALRAGRRQGRRRPVRAVGRRGDDVLAQRQIPRDDRQHRRHAPSSRSSRRRRTRPCRCRRCRTPASPAVRFSPSETKLSLSISGDRSPNNLYTLDLATKKLTKLTDSMSAADRRGGSRRRRDRALQGARRHDGPEHPVEAASGDCRRPRRRRWCGCTAAPAARRRRPIAR